VTGHLFSPGTALLINFVGVIITLTVPYWIGRRAGMNTSQKWIDKYPKFGVILATLMGENIQNPDSPMFWISAGLTVLLYYLYRRRLHGKEAEEK